MEPRLKKTYQDHLNANAKRIICRFKSKVGHTMSKSLLEKLPKPQTSKPSVLSHTNSNHPFSTAIPSYPRLQKLPISHSFKQKPKSSQTMRSTSQESKPTLRLNLKEILHKKSFENPKSDRLIYIQPIPKPLKHSKAMSLENSFAGPIPKICKTSREYINTSKDDKENVEENYDIYRTEILEISKEKLLKSPNIQALCKNSFEMSLEELEPKLTMFYNSLPL
ncbi:unnamed protein product [Blepharisma stoltei]|uniref:Exophilin 5 n=1 Tax=Blepharisma stoltei TaxID=1481888 RepID=A0AAU9JII4_9CILI|nr:unnamed protein product [Blepharisma stoltei]